MKAETFWTYLKGEPPSEEKLRAYLKTLGEDWRNEFKEGVGENGAPLLKAVAALANSRGGEVLLGVTNAGEPVGVVATSDQVTNILRQEGAPTGTWFETNLNNVSPFTRPILVGTKGANVYAIEVTSPGKPVYVFENNEIAFYVRERDQSRRRNALDAMNWLRQTNRQVMLKRIYREYASCVERFNWLDAEPFVSFGFDLPYLRGVLSDGTAYDFLTTDDRAFLLGRTMPDGQRRPGALDMFYNARASLMDWIRDSPAGGKVHDWGIQKAFGFFPGLLKRRDDLREYLIQSGIAVD